MTKNEMPDFQKLVCPEFVEKVDAVSEDPIVNFSKICHWPPKPWYQERAADNILHVLCNGLALRYL